MSLLAEIKAQAPSRKGSLCTISVILSRLDPADRADLTDALVDPHIPNAAIARVLKNRDHPIAAQSIGRHRRGDCLCRSAKS
jgi:hypothetical protein